MTRVAGARRRPGLWFLVTLFLLGAAAIAFLDGSPRAEALVCTKSWAAAVSGDWDTAANWTGGTVPTGADDVCIDVAGTYTVTMTGGHAVHAISVGNATTGTQTLTVSGTSALNTSLSIGADSETTAHGAVVLTSTGGGYAQLQLATHTFTNAGSLQVLAGSGGNRFLDGGPLVNSGSIVVGDNLSSDGALAVTNTGAITANANWTINGSVAHNGGTLASPTGTVEVRGGYTQGNGATTGNPVLVTGSNLQFTGAGAAGVRVVGGANLTGTVAAGQTLTVSGTGALNTTVTLQGNVVNHGTIVETSTGGGFANIELNSFSLTSDGSVQVQAGAGGTRFLEGVGTFTNSGSMSIDSQLVSSGGTAVVNQGSLSLTAGWTVPGSFHSQSGSVAGTGAGQVTSSGTTTIGTGSTSGTPVRVTGGALSFAGNGTTSVLVIGGANLTGTIPVGASLTVSGTNAQNTTVSLQGNVVNNGTIVETSIGGASRTSS
ncbi:MAG: hypothetical protein U0W40_05610 [Acidimicrobiia bacterium]